MNPSPAPKRILLVTGMSGAGKSTALQTLEDLAWEVVDNLPLSLLEQLLSTPLAKGLLAALVLWLLAAVPTVLPTLMAG